MVNTRPYLIEGYSYQVNPKGTIDEIVIQDLLKSNKEVHLILNGFSFQKGLAELSRSLKFIGVSKVIFLRNFYFHPMVLIKTFLESSFVFLSKKNLLSYTINGVLIGDCIYDGIIRHDNKLTITKYSILDYWRWVVGILDYFAIERMNVKKYDALITSHLAYSKFLILSRQFWNYKIPVILLTPTGMDLYSNFDKNLFYHNKNISIKDIIEDIDNDELICLSDKYIEQRVEGKHNQFDVKNSFSGLVLNVEGFNELLSVDLISSFVIVVAAHVFKDGPHHSENLLFKDYYDWLIKTLEIASKVNNKKVLFLVKPHPSAEYYGETKVTENIVNGYSFSDNIKLLDKNINTKSLIGIADLVVTVSGTIGIELACFGVPCITLGTPFYSDFGFSLKPKSLMQYSEQLNNVDQFKKLNKYQIRIARLLFHNYVETENFLTSARLNDDKISVTIDERRIIKSRIVKYINEIDHYYGR